MPRYEKYVAGRLVEAVIPEPGKHDDIHVYGARVLYRQEAGERDGWYLDGEWAELEQARQTVADETIATILADVGDSVEKARVALEAELFADKPRTTLLKKLRDIVGPEPHPSVVDTTEEG